MVYFLLIYFFFCIVLSPIAIQAALTQQQNQFTITLKQLEDSLLARLSAAGGNFLGDYELVENLETTKRTAAEIEVKSKEAKVTEVEINKAREMYRPAAARASLLYFILNDLNKINLIYQFSLKVRFDLKINRSLFRCILSHGLSTNLLYVKVRTGNVAVLGWYCHPHTNKHINTWNTNTKQSYQCIIDLIFQKTIRLSLGESSLSAEESPSTF